MRRAGLLRPRRPRRAGRRRRWLDPDRPESAVGAEPAGPGRRQSAPPTRSRPRSAATTSSRTARSRRSSSGAGAAAGSSCGWRTRRTSSCCSSTRFRETPCCPRTATARRPSSAAARRSSSADWEKFGVVAAGTRADRPLQRPEALRREGPEARHRQRRASRRRDRARPRSTSSSSSSPTRVDELLTAPGATESAKRKRPPSTRRIDGGLDRVAVRVHRDRARHAAKSFVAASASRIAPSLRRARARDRVGEQPHGVVGGRRDRVGLARRTSPCRPRRTAARRATGSSTE